MEKDLKYYIPNKEDVRIGYEYELARNDEQTDWAFYIQDHDFEGLEFYITDGYMRTLYLTSEQIESEEWKVTNLLIGEFDTSIDNAIIEFSKKEYKLLFDSNNHHITLYSKGILYNGECKSINELRTICKWLKI